MKLTAIELGGFKSFAKATRLVFNEGMVAIIGPNGSGKSNLAEAVRWVLGEQSLKQLRGKTRDDILFAGAGEVSRVGRAYVRLTFDNEDGRFPVESAEVTVARSLTSGGDSDYTINGEAVRLLDLQRMLAEAGIGTKTYTVISQGMVDRYLVAGMVERRIFFDEACGVRPLQIRLSQTQKKLERVSEHSRELTTIIQELTPRLKLLVREIAKQAERERLEAEYAEKQAAYLHHAWRSREQEAAKLQSQVETLAARAKEAREVRLQVTARLTSPAGTAASAAGKAPLHWEAQARKLLKACVRLIDSLLQRQSVQEETLRALQNEMARILLPPPTETAPHPPARAELDEAQEQEIAVERELAAAQASLEQASRALALLRGEIIRERGSAFLQAVETTVPEGSAAVSERDIRMLFDAISRLGEADLLSVREYEETSRRHQNLTQQLAEIEDTAANIEQAAHHLEQTIGERFSRQFEIIQTAFAKYFHYLFGGEGGWAQLQLTEQGVEIMAAPPGKRPRHVGLLSGGERTLTSLALLLAIVDAQAPPFVVLDEVDAALDEANSERFAALLQEKSRQTQCLVITHNRETMARADVLYGVTMAQAGISDLYAVKLDELAYPLYPHGT